jgi:hypothetical protein
MSWGKWIIVSFVLFAVFIGTLVTVCIRQDVNLVSKNYYADELTYQDQIDRINHTAQLSEKPVIRILNRQIEIQFKQFNILEEGKLTLFRPSDTKLDKQFNLQASREHEQVFDVASLPAGMYRLQLRWSMEGKTFYMEQVITL